jgi:hypothetical protein
MRILNQGSFVLLEFVAVAGKEEEEEEEEDEEGETFILR